MKPILIDSRLTPPQFAWACCAAGDYPPPQPKRGARYAKSAWCYLCGGETNGVGWPKKLAIGPTFTDVSAALAPASDAICQACAATSQAEGWAQSVNTHPERGLPAFFPQKENKPPRAWNWLYSSHLFVAPSRHECPSRSGWRALLADPPAPPFIAIIAPMGKKQLIFKGVIASDRNVFPLRVDDDLLAFDLAKYLVAVADFERLYRLGFSKDSILSGHYSPKALLEIGAARWREAERPAREWRSRSPQLWSLCHYVAQREEDKL